MFIRLEILSWMHRKWYGFKWRTYAGGVNAFRDLGFIQIDYYGKARMIHIEVLGVLDFQIGSSRYNH